MADTLTGYIAEFAEVLKENGEDILETAEGLEKAFLDGIGFLKNPETIETIKNQTLEGFTALITEFEINEDSSLEGIDRFFENIITQLKDNTGIDLATSIDPSNILKSVKELVPIDLLPTELKPFVEQIIQFFEKVDLSDIRVSTKIINDPVPKPSQDLGSTISTLSSVDKELVSYLGIFESSNSSQKQIVINQGKGITNNSESYFGFIQMELEKIFPDPSSWLNEVVNEMELAVMGSGFFTVLEEKRDKLLETITSGNISISKLSKEISLLLADVSQVAIDCISAIFDILFDKIQEILEKLIQVLNIKNDSLSGALLSQLGLSDSSRLISLPILIISIPITVINKALSGSNVSIPSIEQETQPLKILYGTVQIIKGFTPLIIGYIFTQWDKPIRLEEAKKDPDNSTLELLKVKTDFKKSFFSLAGPFLDLLGQLFSIPDKNTGEWGKRTWYYQWIYNVGFWTIVAIWDIIAAWIALRDLQADSDPESGISRIKPSFPMRDTIISSVQIGGELLHLYFFIKTVNDEEKDWRLATASIIDPLPGIVGGFVSIAQAIITYTVERKEAGIRISRFPELLTNIQTKINEIIGLRQPLTPANLIFTTDALRTKLNSIKAYYFEKFADPARLLKNDKFEGELLFPPGHEVYTLINSFLQRCQQFNQDIDSLINSICNHYQQDSTVTLKYLNEVFIPFINKLGRDLERERTQLPTNQNGIESYTARRQTQEALTEQLKSKITEYPKGLEELKGRFRMRIAHTKSFMISLSNEKISLSKRRSISQINQTRIHQIELTLISLGHYSRSSHFIQRNNKHIQRIETELVGKTSDRSNRLPQSILEVLPVKTVFQNSSYITNLLLTIEKNSTDALTLKTYSSKRNRKSS